MEAKAREGVRLMETTLRDFEARALEIHNAGLSQVASDFLSSGKKHLDDKVGESLVGHNRSVRHKKS